LLVLKQKALLTDNLSKTVNFARHYISELEKIIFTGGCRYWLLILEK